MVGLARSQAPCAGRLDLVDLNDSVSLANIVRREPFDWVFHLAGSASPGQSFRDPAAAWKGNLDATRSLYDALAKQPKPPRTLFVSTGLIYGNAQPDHAFVESDELRPTSPYAASKAAADLLSYQVSLQGLPIVRARAFTHIGPGQSAEYAVANFARQIVAIERGELPPVIETGDLSSERDLTDVRDVVRAYIRLMESGRIGEAYNVATGETIIMRAVLSKLLEQTHSRCEVRERPDPNRTNDTSTMRVDVCKIQSDAGWSPNWSLEQTLHDVLDDWRSRPSSTSR